MQDVSQELKQQAGGSDYIKRFFHARPHLNLNLTSFNKLDVGDRQPHSKAPDDPEKSDFHMQAISLTNLVLFTILQCRHQKTIAAQPDEYLPCRHANSGQGLSHGLDSSAPLEKNNFLYSGRQRMNNNLHAGKQDVL